MAVPKNIVYFKQRNFYSRLLVGFNNWISGLKKDTCNRHWAGHGKIFIDRRIVNDYLNIVNEEKLNLNKYEIVDLKDDFPTERISKLLNE